VENFFNLKFYYGFGFDLLIVIYTNFSGIDCSK